MVALTKDNNIREVAGGGMRFSNPVAAATTIYRHAIVGLNAAGDAVPAAPAVPTIRGIAMERADNVTGAAGDISVPTLRGVWVLGNDGSIDRTDIDANAFVIDDQTVGNAGTLVAGKILDVTAEGVVVEIR